MLKMVNNLNGIRNDQSQWTPAIEVNRVSEASAVLNVRLFRS